MHSKKKKTIFVYQKFMGFPKKKICKYVRIVKKLQNLCKLWGKIVYIVIKKNRIKRVGVVLINGFFFLKIFGNFRTNIDFVVVHIFTL